MKRSLLHTLLTALLVAMAVSAFVSCHDDDGGRAKPIEGSTTFIMYFPWSGNDIYPYFLKNIADMEKAVGHRQTVLTGKRLMVFISQSETTAVLFEVKQRGTVLVRDTLKKYISPVLNTAAGIHAIFGDIKAKAPSERYAMTIGSHGMGWLPPGARVDRLPQNRSCRIQRQFPLTRYFGHGRFAAFQTEVKTLAEALRRAAMHMDFILFDDCYMANIETAYDLRKVADFLIASTCEVMIEGVPYAMVGQNLLERDYGGVCRGFIDFYSAFFTPCGTLSVVDCREVEGMAEVMREINRRYVFDAAQYEGRLQKLDGISPTIFYDFGDYVTNLCTDGALYERYRQQLARLVVHRVNTPTFYSVYNQVQTPILTFSGITISDPSLHPSAIEQKRQTAWHQATH
ncbi:MAG: clostripain-related cysteine peptidase [Prevotella sp.]|nr:clostripain-related cysteine peptidase [Prevotella sp.]